MKLNNETKLNFKIIPPNEGNVKKRNCMFSRDKSGIYRRKWRGIWLGLNNGNRGIVAFVSLIFRKEGDKYNIKYCLI